MLLKAISDGSISGTGTVIAESRIVGGVLVSADGTNAATVILRVEGVNGKRVFHIVTKTPIFITGPIGVRDGAITSQIVYYDISGTGASAQVYEWVE